MRSSRRGRARVSKHEAMAQVGGAGIPAGAVLDTMELQNDPTFEQRGIMQMMQHPKHGAVQDAGLAGARRRQAAARQAVADAGRAYRQRADGLAGVERHRSGKAAQRRRGVASAIGEARATPALTSLRGASRRSNPPPVERSSARQAGDCFPRSSARRLLHASHRHRGQGNRIWPECVWRPSDPLCQNAFGGHQSHCVGAPPAGPVPPQGRMVLTKLKQGASRMTK